MPYKYVFGQKYYNKALSKKHINYMLFNMLGEPEGERSAKAYLMLKRTTEPELRLMGKFEDIWFREYEEMEESK
jgi:hypothetical protein